MKITLFFFEVFTSPQNHFYLCIVLVAIKSEVTLKETIDIIYDSVKTRLRACVFCTKIHNTAHKYKFSQFSVSDKIISGQLALTPKRWVLAIFTPCTS